MIQSITKIHAACVFIFFGAAFISVHNVYGAQKPGGKAMLIRYKGILTESHAVGMNAVSRSSTYSSVHVFEKSDDAYHVRSFLLKEREGSADSATKKETTALMNECTAYNAISSIDKDTAASPGKGKTLPLERHFAVNGFRELALLPDHDYTAGDSFEMSVKARLGTFAVGYKTIKEKMYQGQKCILIKRTVALKTPSTRLPVKIPQWEENILFASETGLILARKLNYTVTCRQQRQSVSFDVKAITIEKLSENRLKEQLAQWDKAQLLDKAFKKAAVPQIQAACKQITKESDYAGMIVAANQFCKRLLARQKIVKGFSNYTVPEIGMRYALYVPAGYNPEKENLLILSLHGQGGSEQPMAQMWIPYADKNNAVVVAPKSPLNSWSTDDIKRILYVFKEVQATYKVSPERTIGFGFSAGGALTLYMHFGVTERLFSTLIIASGHLGIVKLRKKIASNMAKFSNRIKDLPIYIVTGSKDPGVAGIRADKKLFETNGARVHYVEVPGMGHTFNGTLIPPIYAWLKTVFPDKE